MNYLVKIVLFFIGFAAMFGAMFWLGNMAKPKSDGKDSDKGDEK